ncbi:MAG: hypothetical protein J0G29_01000 [Alphaproteobacteria bacterium]|nr:hypothetical protein [Alphaproteobacteria bacterium]OJV47139.1 MAG: hypothetical protein BGO28_01720 [Alphaproteobacteria bacterium 43-37]
MKKSRFKTAMLSGIMMAMSFNAVVPCKAKALSFADLSQAASDVVQSVGTSGVVAASMRVAGQVAAVTKQTAMNAYAAQQAFAQHHPFMMTGAKIAAVTGLTILGAPAWAVAPAFMASEGLAKDIAGGYLNHVMSQGALQAIDLWAPSLLESQPLAIGLMVAAPLLSYNVAKTAVSAMASMAGTAISYAKQHPVQAIAAVGVAGLAAWYGTPYIRDALYALGDTTLSATKAIIDNGSGAIKGTAIVYNPFTKTILKETPLGQYGVSLSKTMQTVTEGATTVKMLDSKTMVEASDAIDKLVETAKKAGISPRHITGIATAWARSGATNVADYIEMVRQKTGVTLNVASQLDEGKLGLVAAQSAGIDTSLHPILDTGGGSLQLSREMPQSMTARFFGSGEPDVLVYGTEVASATFANQMQQDYGVGSLADARWSIENLEWMTGRSLELTSARNTALTGDTLPQLQKMISKYGDGSVIGIGNVYAGILKLVRQFTPETTRITEEGLTVAMEGLDGLSMEQLGTIIEKAGMPKFIAPSIATNLPLVRGIMKAFNVTSIDVASVNSGNGAFFYPQFWQDALSKVAGIAEVVPPAVGSVVAPPAEGTTQGASTPEARTS